LRTVKTLWLCGLWRWGYKTIPDDPVDACSVGLRANRIASKFGTWYVPSN
jgi:hypothetical protein